MKKKIIKLTEWDVHNMVNAVVHRVLNEAVGYLKTGYEQYIVNYIKSFGHKGKLPNYEGRLIDAYGPYMEEAYNWACKSTDGVQRDGFAFFKRHFSIDIVGRFNHNKRGLIYVERNIDIDTNQEINELELKKEDLINGTNNYAIEGKKREIEKLIKLRKEASLIGKIKYIRRLRKEEQALEELQNKNKQR
jgi:hypothetical protein